MRDDIFPIAAAQLPARRFSLPLLLRVNFFKNIVPIVPQGLETLARQARREGRYLRGIVPETVPDRVNHRP